GSPPCRSSARRCRWRPPTRSSTRTASSSTPASQGASTSTCRRSRRSSTSMADRSVDKKLAAIKTASEAELATALRSPAGVLVAAAVRRVGGERLDKLVPELAPAFERMSDAKRDPGCRAKVAIARALHELDHWEDRVFVAGLTIVQREGWGAE